jgi:7-cyano-7-deazaguanine synthase
MCSILGAVLHDVDNNTKRRQVNAILDYIWTTSQERGRDGRGYVSFDSFGHSGDFVFHSEERRDPTRCSSVDLNAPMVMGLCPRMTVVGNMRAEPTTEYVSVKRRSDQQPYTCGGWSIVHNGTIANDKELRTHALPTSIDSASIAELLAPMRPTLDNFAGVIRKLKGSFAILATHENCQTSIFVAANYRPIWYIETEFGYFFASARNYLPIAWAPRMLTPYTVAEFGECVRSFPLYKSEQSDTALVVCSGGLDSVVSAAYAQKKLGYKLHLIHFLYGSRAEGPEVIAVRAVARALGAEITLFPLPVYQKGDSPLLDPDSKVAGGEAGAEFAHEWVPARNLLLLSVATAFAEARGISVIVLGNNLEEAGAYPDNEPEFIAKFNDLLPFAVGDGKRMKVIMPVGNMMKHEIVALGKEVGAPMELTWSCYRAGELHCGKCGPCFMRRRAFEINGFPEVIQYKDQQ